MRQAGSELAGFRHEALFYGDDDELLAGVLPAVREALARDAGVLIALPWRSTCVVREGLGAAASAVTFADMESTGRNPGRLIPAWREFVRTAGPGAPLGVGEPIWEGRSQAELVEAERHETLLNLAFAQAETWRMICPYDATRLDPAALERARRSHPHVVEHGEESPAHAYRREIPLCDPLPDPAGEPRELRFAFGDLAAVRDFVTLRGFEAGMPHPRVTDLVLSVDELATNTMRYTSAGGVVRTWQDDGHLLCEVADTGHIADPLAGRELPPPDQPGGRGLWLVNQLCDLVQVRSSPGSSVVRVHMRID